VRPRFAGLRWVATVAALSILVGCDADLQPSGGGIETPSGHFVGDGVSFDYPSAWREGHFDVRSSFSSVIVYLSTAPLADPCDRGPNAIACVREAAAALDPDGVLVTWSRNGFPGWTFDGTRGRRVAVGGRAATIEDGLADEGCRGIGGERDVLVTIPDLAADANWTSVRACLRGPDLERLRGEVGAMLASVQWH
jgi:hypothetical protein